jgi:hypothetical protein
MATRIGIYTLRIMAPDPPTDKALWLASWDRSNKEVINNIGTALTEAENTVNQHLPQGYYCKVEDA